MKKAPPFSSSGSCLAGLLAALVAGTALLCALWAQRQGAPSDEYVRANHTKYEYRMWFPQVDRNPQTFTDIPRAKPEDFQSATQKVFRSKSRASSITLPVE
jgi:hypothetical protein